MPSQYCELCGCYLNGGMIARDKADSAICVECGDDSSAARHEIASALYTTDDDFRDPLTGFDMGGE
jgi:hypothetical protein